MPYKKKLRYETAFKYLLDNGVISFIVLQAKRASREDV